MAESRMDIGFHVFRKTLELCIMSGWPIQRSEGGCRGRVQSDWYDRRTRFDDKKR